MKIWLDTLFTASYDCTVSKIKFKTSEMGLEILDLKLVQGPDEWADAMGLDEMGRYICTQNDDNFALDIWDINLIKILITLSGHTDEVHCGKFVPTEPQALSGGADKTVRLWNLIDGQCLRILSGTFTFPKVDIWM